MKITQFQIFPNKYKKEEKHPDYKISIKVGEKFVEVGAGWKKKTAKGDMYLSCSLKEIAGLEYSAPVETPLPASPSVPVPSGEEIPF